MNTVSDADDRRAVSDLIIGAFACLDNKDWAGYASKYAEDGILELPWAKKSQKDLEAQTELDLSRFSATHHISTNHVIEIEGDTARSSSYLIAVHVFADPAVHADVGITYVGEHRRTPDGWKHTHVRVTPIWTAGAELGL